MPFEFKVFGQYPEGYNARVHGEYKPWVNYDAKPGEKRFWDVKISELPKWVMDKPWSPTAAARMVSRRFHLYVRNYIAVKNPGQAWFVHFYLFMYTVGFYFSGTRKKSTKKMWTYYY